MVDLIGQPITANYCVPPPHNLIRFVCSLLRNCAEKGVFGGVCWGRYGVKKKKVVVYVYNMYVGLQLRGVVVPPVNERVVHAVLQPIILIAQLVRPT